MIHHVFANKSNIGDWLSAMGIQSLFKPHQVTEHLCDEPFVPETLERLAAADPEDVIVIGGGGLFMDYFVPFWEGFREIAGRTPFCIWGVGYCDHKRKISRPPVELLSEIIGKSFLCSVRDELTRRWLPDCRLPPPTACPSLCVLKPAAEPGFGVLHVDNYIAAGADVYERMDGYARQFAEETGRPYRRTNNRIQPGSASELSSTLNRYSSSDVVVSSALHGCVIGVALGKKAIAVSGDHKIDYFMREVGLADWLCDIAEVENVAPMLDAIAEQSPASTIVERHRQANRKTAHQILLSVAKAAK
jgi:polysaccharide pyruvyl transferase WcaK-like protein